MTEAITFLFHDDTVDLIDRLQKRFGLKSREAALAEALKLLAVADENPLFVFRNEQFMEVECGDHRNRNADDIQEEDNV